jgi:hypothetical protein
MDDRLLQSGAVIGGQPAADATLEVGERCRLDRGMNDREPRIDAGEERTIVTGIRRGRSGAGRALDVRQGFRSGIELALIVRRPPKRVMPEPLERVLRTGHLTGEARQVIDGIRRLGRVAVKCDRRGWCDRADGSQRNAESSGTP